MKFIKEYWFPIGLLCFILFGFYKIISFLNSASEEMKLLRYDIVCHDNGEKVFEKRGQKRGFGYDGRWREISIYENGKHVKTIVMSESTTCETSYYKVYDE